MQYCSSSIRNLSLWSSLNSSSMFLGSLLIMKGLVQCLWSHNRVLEDSALGIRWDCPAVPQPPVFPTDALETDWVLISPAVASTRCRTNTSSSGSLPLLIRNFSFLISYFSLFALQTDRVMTLDSRFSLPLSTDQYLFQIRGNKSLFPLWCKMWTKKGKHNSIVSEYIPLIQQLGPTPR